MKNKFIALALVTLSIATTTVSCTKDDLNPTDVKAQNVETTKVDFTVNAENNATGKMVDRSAAPLYVDNLTITATCNGYGMPWTATENFTFGTSTPGTSPLATGFGLNNVALGINTFTASSTSATANKRLSLGNVILQQSNQDVLNFLKELHTPYITTVATPVQKTITKTGNETVSLNMTTQNGRILAKFVQEPQADNYYTTVGAVVDGVSIGESAITPAGNGLSASALAFEWSNENATVGKSVTFTIKIYEKTTTPNTMGALLNTITKTVSVKAATTTLATYTVHDADVTTNMVDGAISLVFPTIATEVIND